jgi:hypothetical protein
MKTTISKIMVLFTIIGCFGGRVSGQQLASEKPLDSYYSKTAKKKNIQPVATKSRQELASEKAIPQPSVPHYKSPVIKPHQKTAPKPASEKPIDMVKINRQRKRQH